MLNIYNIDVIFNMKHYITNHFDYRLADRQAMLRAAGTIIGLGAAAAKGNSSCK